MPTWIWILTTLVALPAASALTWYTSGRAKPMSRRQDAALRQARDRGVEYAMRATQPGPHLGGFVKF